MKELETIVEKTAFEMESSYKENMDVETAKAPDSISTQDNLHWLIIII